MSPQHLSWIAGNLKLSNVIIIENTESRVEMHVHTKYIHYKLIAQLNWVGEHTAFMHGVYAHTHAHGQEITS